MKTLFKAMVIIPVAVALIAFIAWYLYLVIWGFLNNQVGGSLLALGFCSGFIGALGLAWNDDDDTEYANCVAYIPWPDDERTTKPGSDDE